MTIFCEAITDALQKSKRVFWAGELAPRWNMDRSTVIYSPEHDFRLPSHMHQSFEIVFLVERDLGALKQWPLILDEALRLLAPGAMLVLRLRQSPILSVFELASFVHRWTAGRVTMVHEALNGPDLTIAFRMSTVERRCASLNGFTFAMITDGRKMPEVAAFVESVLSLRSLNRLNWEILVCGPASIPAALGALSQHVELVEEPSEFATKGWITRKKNLLVDAAQYSNILIVHDRYVLAPEFLEDLREFGGDFDVVMCRQETSDGERIPDWVALADRFNWSTPGTLEYGDYHPYLYINGGVTLAKTLLLRETRWSELLFWGQAEDVDLSRRLQDQGVTPRLARKVRVITGSMRAGFLEGFERLPWHHGSYAETDRPRWLAAPAFRFTASYELNRLVSMAGLQDPLQLIEHGLVFPSDWHADRLGLVHEGGGSIGFSLRHLSDSRELRLRLVTAEPAEAWRLQANGQLLSFTSTEGSFVVDLPAAAVSKSGIIHFTLSSYERFVLQAFAIEDLERSCYELETPQLISTGTASAFLLSGWHSAEDWGVWSSGERASFHVDLAAVPDRDLWLTMLLQVVAFEGVDERLIGVSANGVPLSSETIAAGQTEKTIHVRLPRLLLSRTRNITVELQISSVVVPIQLGISVDTRRLGFGLRQFLFSRTQGAGLTPDIAVPTQVVRPNVELGEPIRINEHTAAAFLRKGWNEGEAWGAWTKAASAYVELNLPERPDSDLVINLHLHGFVPEALPPLFAGVFINDFVVGVARFDQEYHEQKLRFTIPQHLITSGSILLRLDASRTAAPAIVGSADDERVLGIGLVSFALEKA